MPLQSGGPAPYAPPATVLGLIEAYRNRGLSTPFDAAVLVRAGVAETMVPRTLQALRLLDLIESDGQPTSAFETLRRAGGTEFQAKLAAVIREAYAEVFQFTDPATDTVDRIADAFRAFEPIGQLRRMVTLFLGLCEAAGLSPARTSNGKQSGSVASRARVAPRRRPDAAVRPPSVGSKARVRNEEGGLIPAPITGLLASLPSEGSSWTQERRDNFLKTLGVVLDFVFPIAQSEATASGRNDPDGDS